MSNIDWSKMKTASEIRAESLAETSLIVRRESTRRIESLWSIAGQSNVALGLYSEAERQACVDWINAHRAVCQALIERPDLLELEISDDSLWPSAPTSHS